MSSELKPISLESMMNESSSNRPSLKPDTLLKDIFAPYDVGEAQSQYSEDDVSAISHEVSKINSALSIEDDINAPTVETVERDISEWYTEKQISTPLIFECVKTQNVQITKPRCCKKLIVKDYDDNTSNGLLLEITDFNQKTLSVSSGARLAFYGEPWSEEEIAAEAAKGTNSIFNSEYGSTRYPLVTCNTSAAMFDPNLLFGAFASYSSGDSNEITVQTAQSNLKKLVSGGYDSFKVYGNIASLIDGENFSTIRSLDERMSYAFAYLFCTQSYNTNYIFSIALSSLNCSLSTSAPSYSCYPLICATDYSEVVIPFSGKLPKYAFNYMFAGGSVIVPPKVIGGYGYYSHSYMFINSGITKLVNSHILELKSPIVGEGDYLNAFSECQLLNYIPKINITDVDSKYKNFAGGSAAYYAPATASSDSPFRGFTICTSSDTKIKSYYSAYSSGRISEIFDSTFTADIKIDIKDRVQALFTLAGLISSNAINTGLIAPNGAMYNISLGVDEVYFNNKYIQPSYKIDSTNKPFLYIGPDDSATNAFLLSKKSKFNMDISIRNVAVDIDGNPRNSRLFSMQPNSSSSNSNALKGSMTATTLLPCIWPNAAAANDAKNVSKYYYYDNVSIKINLPKDRAKAAIATILLSGYYCDPTYSAHCDPGSSGYIGINPFKYSNGYSTTECSNYYLQSFAANVSPGSSDTNKVLIGPAQDMGANNLRDLRANYFADIDPVEVNFVY